MHIGQSGTKSCITDGLHVFPHANKRSHMSRERGKLEISNHAVLQASVLLFYLWKEQQHLWSG